MSKEDKIQKALTQLRNKPENKRCMDCSATLTQYVVMDFGTWVCATCSGLHREFSHKVKSPTMSTFSPDEVKKLEKSGNEAARATWRAKWSSSEFPEPASGDANRIRDFIRYTYKDKRWYQENGSTVSSVSSTSHLTTAPPSSSKERIPVIQQPSSTSLTTQPLVKKESNVSLINWDDLPNEVPPTQPAPPTNNTFNPFAIQQPNPTPAPPTQNPFFIPNPTPSPYPVNPFAIQPPPVVYQPNSFGVMPNAYIPPMTVNPMPNTGYVENRPRAPSQPKATLDDDFINSLVGGLSVSASTPTSNATPPVKHSNDAFDFPALRPNNQPALSSTNSTSNISPIQPPPTRSAIMKNMEKKQQEDVPTCPICARKFTTSTSNAEINRHVDECLNRTIIQEASGTSSGAKATLPKPVKEPDHKNSEEPWQEWFDLSKMEWYYGAIDRQEAERLLFRCSEDSFLVRKSSVKDSYAFSLYNHKKGTVTHTLIVPKDGGYIFQDTSRVYPTILDLVTKSPECKDLRPPPKVNVPLE